MRAIQLLLLSLVIIIVLQSNKGGRNDATTGAPFESNKNACAACHSGGTFAPEIKFLMKDADGNEVSAYEANKSYVLEFNLSTSTGNPKYYGFQAVIVDGTNKSAGKITSNGQNVRNITIQSRSYLTQSTAREDGIFTASWQAPENIGSLKVYVSGIAANGNNSTGGDKAVKTEFTIPVSITSSSYQVEFSKPKLMCNLGCDNIEFSLDVEDIMIFDVNGVVHFNTKSKTSAIDVSQISGGKYYINYAYNGKRYTEPFVR
jgi:hypothetical protein